MMPHDFGDKSFESLEIEYKECSALFQQGFDLVFNLVRGFLYFNAILFGLLILVFRANEQKWLVNYLALVCAAFGILGAILVPIVHSRMVKYFRWWLRRAAELEVMFGGTLYSRTFEIEFEGRKKSFQSYRVAYVLYSAFGLFWLLIFGWSLPPSLESAFASKSSSISQQIKPIAPAVKVPAQGAQKKDAAPAKSPNTKNN